jgi:acyl-coenzyme A thioesterase PaaI-like protein
MSDQHTHTSQSRLAAAAAIRDLGHRLISTQPDDSALDQIAALVDQALTVLEGAPPRGHVLMAARAEQLAARDDDGTVLQTPEGSLFPDSLVSGRANPLGINASILTEDGEAVGRVTLGPAFEGAPGRCHGGVVAALIDETMGRVLAIEHLLAFTGWLKVTYRAPTPLGVPIVCRAHATSKAGRKLMISATLHDGDTLLAEAEALFIIVDAAQFASAAASMSDGQ